jgi:CheY-like chemotaxis protein
MEVPSFQPAVAEGPIALAVAKSTASAGASSSAARPVSAKDARSGNRKNRNRVMIVGRIRELALYRAEVLRHEGFQVLTPEDKEEAMAIIHNGGFDIAVLSYTLPSALVQELTDEIRESCPDCRIIAIADSKRMDRRINPDAVALAEDGPPALLRAVRKLLR